MSEKPKVNTNKLRQGVTIVLLTLAAFGVGSILDQQPVAMRWRYAATQALMEANPLLEPGQNVCVVAVDNDMFYGQNFGATPFSLALIAKGIAAAASNGARSVSLDFDYVSPDLPWPKASAYAKDLQLLKAAILDASKKVDVNLPLTLTRDRSGFEATFLDDLRVAGNSRIHFAHINIPRDVRFLPLGMLNTATRQEVDSLALAIARSTLQGSGHNLDGDLSTGPFMVAFRSPETLVRLTLTELLTGPVAAVRQKVSGRAVLFGGAWSARTREGATRVDEHDSPVGRLPGVFIHAIYADAAISGQVFVQIRPLWTNLLKILFVTGIAIGFSTRVTLTNRLLIVAVALLLYVCVAYLAFVAAGAAFDVTLPLLLLLFHAVAEHVLSTHKEN